MCFMWATFPQIDDALRVMEAWGFEYKTCAFVWIKKNRKSNTNFWGMGAYTRANAEICLLGVTPGFKPAAQIKSHAVHQVIESPVEEHSKKPEETRRRIVELLGDVPRIELFARQRVDENYKETYHLHDLLTEYHKKLWWYITQCDYNIYFHNGKVYTKYTDIFTEEQDARGNEM